MRWHCRSCGPFDTDADGPLGRAQAADHVRLLHPDLAPVDTDPTGSPLLVDRTEGDHR